MKKVLYLTNIKVPYRAKFFNELSKYCDLTVVYERSKSSTRNNQWMQETASNYKEYYLDGIKIGGESTFSFKILKFLRKDFDEIIIGCYSTSVGIFSNFVLRLMHKPFYLNFDGEPFADDKSLKTLFKKIVMNGATKYIVAGVHSADSVKRAIKDKSKKVYPYFFSSLSENELINNATERNLTHGKEGAYILVVGQYFDYKGLDIAVKAAKKFPNIRFKFVGMNNRSELFIKENDIENMKNIEVIPFLNKEDLITEYKNCQLLVLPSRQECWGLVVNEAASYGVPIVSTLGSGSAVEFLLDAYPQFLAKPGDIDSLVEAIKKELEMENPEDYSKFLIQKCTDYSIEKSVKCHMESFE